MKFELGELLEDKITGFKGTVMVRAEYFTGCTHYGLQCNELRDGKMVDWEWIDSGRLMRVAGADKINFTENIRSTGGPHPNGPQM
ncbi:hypothetical protein LCGC14_2159960 [marine sediment metagenome]|uniref:Uncharacterized protein n=2 Tax=root TaxID=1 RepID=A0A831QR35_9FLAO|nr:hypothetical protein [Pricia sp.]HEA21141.1 hypothetical protein [Pricia antarctica]